MLEKHMTDVGKILDFMLAGNATLSLKSARTGKHFTYKVKRAENRQDGPANAPLRWFVSLLTGADNTGDFVYIGLLEQRTTTGALLKFRTTQASKLPLAAAPVAGFSWFTHSLVEENPKKLGRVEFWHEGRCGKCGRRLTDPASIELGMGPTCRGTM